MLIVYSLLALAVTTNTAATDTSLLNRKPVVGGFTNSWAVEIHGGPEAAHDIAKRLGFINLGKIGSLANMYHFALNSNGNQAKVGLGYRTNDLKSESMVGFVEQQRLRHWEKKYFKPNDPLWNRQWTVNNTGQTGERNLYLDLNAEPAWIQGYTGSGIIVGVVDDGVQHFHNDLRNNYVSEYSYDFNNHDSDPSPSYGHSHGTACAGQISMIHANGVCGVGVAYNSKIAGIRLLGSDTTDLTDAAALSHHRNNIDIYSNSWGPPDTGILVQGPLYLTSLALKEGAEMGRNGKGNIFTWAAGNGGGKLLDSCSADGFSQSIYSISVGAYSQNGAPASYDEKCSAKQTVAYVDNTRSSNLDVVTVSLNNGCTRTFSGTSSSTPYVSAVIALTLEANPQLTWRDVQYLVAYTSNPDNLLSLTDDEFVNGAGLTVSHHFGFGAIDAEAMVTRARKWTNVPSQIINTVTPSVTSGSAKYNSPLEITFTYNGPIRYLEHIVVTMSLNASGYNLNVDEDEAYDILSSNYDNLYPDRYRNRAKRGDISANLTSPMGSTSTLLFNRPYDLVTVEGYYNWPFLSVLHWGENPIGQWTVRIGWSNSFRGSATLNNISVSLYGVSSVPASVSSIPGQCDPTCSRTKGCSAPGPQSCDACNRTLVRNPVTLNCIRPVECSPPNEIASGYCYLPSSGWVFMMNNFLTMVLLAFSIASVM